MGRLDEALETMEIAVDLLEDSAAKVIASRQSRSVVRAARQAQQKPAPDSVGKDDLAGTLFSPEQLTNVKQQLDTAIEQLESALETADGAR